MNSTFCPLLLHNKIKFLVLFAGLGMMLVLGTGEQVLAQGINYPVSNPAGTSGTGNARTDPDNLFIRNNIAGMTEIAVNDTEEADGKLGESGKGGWRFLGELQGAYFRYERERNAGPFQGVKSNATIYPPGLAGEITYTSGNHKYAFGVGVYSVFAFQSKVVDPATLGPRALFFDSKVGSTDVAFGGAARLNKYVSVGGSFIFGRGFVDLKAPNAALLAAGILQDSRVDVTDIGAPGFSVGVNLRPNDKINFGFNYKSRREYDMTGVLTTAIPRPVTGGVQLVPFKADITTQFKLPQVVESGVQIKATKKFTFVADYRFYDYPDALKTVVVKSEQSGQPLLSQTINAKNVHSVRFGSIYTLNDTTRLNFGLAFTSDGFRDQFINPGLINTGGIDVSGAIYKKILGQWFNVGIAGLIGRERIVEPQVNPAFSGAYRGHGIMISLGMRLRK